MAEAARQMPDAIPAWDGNARGWRRYSREVMWYVLGTKKSNRAFLAPRLIAKLTGAGKVVGDVLEPDRLQGQERSADLAEAFGCISFGP